MAPNAHNGLAVRPGSGESGRRHREARHAASGAVRAPGAPTIDSVHRERIAASDLWAGPRPPTVREPIVPPIVLTAEELAPAAIDVLAHDFDVRHVDGTDRPALLAALADAHAVIVRSATDID